MLFKKATKIKRRRKKSRILDMLAKMMLWKSQKMAKKLARNNLKLLMVKKRARRPKRRPKKREKKIMTTSLMVQSTSSAGWPVALTTMSQVSRVMSLLPTMTDRVLMSYRAKPLCRARKL